MGTHWIRVFRKLSQNLSVRAGAYCLVAISVALLAVVIAPYVPDEMADILGSDAVDHILTIVASSMLVVVTFSLSTLIASYSVAGSSAPSRATSLILQDRTAQNALSTFLGAFIFSIVALVALSTSYYGPKGRVILFVTTVIMLIAVIWTIIKWIGRLSGIGKLANVIEEIETTTKKSIRSHPGFFLKQENTEDQTSDKSLVIESNKAGFIQTIDIKNLSELVDAGRLNICIDVHTGEFVYPKMPLAQVTGAQLPLKKTLDKIQNCFVIDKSRTFEDDPRFGFIVLSEIASHALSPGVNDLGTAIEILGSQVRLISEISRIYSEGQDQWWSKALTLRQIRPDEVVDDAFHAISRDGAAFAEVGIFLQKSLRGIHSYPEFLRPAIEAARKNLYHCQQAMKDPTDFDRVERASRWIDAASAYLTSRN
ncbi:MAG: hypothetical protein COT74_10745 [Bdellovibrionales bacterium CG10_big_fil_rev_8_21_14_0_10_45_34]|nr:MAG: hypothetical protein COT74_10745 [Bdellovibrionales bacterium CG10_big_fil_rev_8_21_14_0_10_45_34]